MHSVVSPGVRKLLSDPDARAKLFNLTDLMKSPGENLRLAIAACREAGAQLPAFDTSDAGDDETDGTTRRERPRQSASTADCGEQD